jgi:type II restriction/modification system DNA methylase subunit YeeA
MNRSALKKYAPQARLDFIEAVTLRARRLGLDPALPVNIEQTGDVLLIGGQPFPASIAKQRATLAQRIQQQGFTVVVEALAYTWFNRLVAIRFMELKAYLSHGYRVLSHPQGQQPEILDHVQHIELAGLDKAEVIRLKTAGNQDEALYREILLAQCHELHRNMPFLFEALDDATELLLPDNLLRTDSPIACLVNGIEETDWQEVEVIGWLYQFYISEKKDQVIGKVVKSEDIPAATQLFTPNWIVQYLVQNSVGRLWIMANPSSRLKEKMPYYIEPAEQTPEVQAQLDSMIKVRMDEEGGTLNPESLTILDPACGSGHILVEAYNLLRVIYEERGYRLRDIPRLILQKNLFGLDIDNRAAQLAGFALMMKAREDDRRLFDDEGAPPYLNVMALQESAGLPDEVMAQVIIDAAIQIEGGEVFHAGHLFGGDQVETRHSSGLTALDLRQLIRLFEHGKTFGSLIRVPDVLKVNLGKVVELLASVRSQGNALSRSYACQVLEHFALPASLLAMQYDAVIANPPYMGGKAMNACVKSFAKENYQSGKSDLFAMFMARGFELCRSTGFNSMITMQSWMFLSSYELMREKILSDRTIHTLAHLGARAFGEISGEVVQTVAFVFQAHHVVGFRPVFFRLVDGAALDKEAALVAGQKRYECLVQDEFSKIPGSPIAYWVPKELYRAFQARESIDTVSPPRIGMMTTDNERFLRYWYEIDFGRIGFGIKSVEESIGSDYKWFPYNKGGGFRKWAGFQSLVVNWRDGGSEISESGMTSFRGKDFYFKSGLTWSDIATGDFSCRYTDGGSIFDIKGTSSFPGLDDMGVVGTVLNSKVGSYILNLLNPTMSYQSGDVRRIPLPDEVFARREFLNECFGKLVDISTRDWNCAEVSWGFLGSPLAPLHNESSGGVEMAFGKWHTLCKAALSEMMTLEKNINEFYIHIFGLGGEVSADVDEGQVVLSRASRESDTQRLFSYFVGCMMGRYSLDEPGLIYAHSGGYGFDSTKYRKFPADADGIIPITEDAWFDDDAAERVREFVKVIWGDHSLMENMEWLAASLGRKAGESVDEAIRRYLSSSFYRDHLQTYKKRPIYWLFSSGKQKAFECLVYLHRYNEGTLSRMRMEYVVPLQSRMQARLDKLADDINDATSSAQQKSLQKRKDKITKQLEELRRFDEALRPYADRRITIDLDDGVKVNYGKFGNLLAEVKAITGGKED